MGAKPKPERKASVLHAMADYLLGAGVADASLRPAASALGTSPRMLLYHFRSKEELLVAALREVRRRETEMLVREIQRLPDATSDDVLGVIWRWYASPRRAPYLRLFFEAWGLGLQNPRRYEGFLETVRKDLLVVAEDSFVQRGYPQREASAMATFMIGAFRGLLLDLVTNKDRGRLDDAMAVFNLVTRVMAEQGAPAVTAELERIAPARSKAPRRAVRRRAAPRARRRGAPK